MLTVASHRAPRAAPPGRRTRRCRSRPAAPRTRRTGGRRHQGRCPVPAEHGHQQPVVAAGAPGNAAQGHHLRDRRSARRGAQRRQHHADDQWRRRDRPQLLRQRQRQEGLRQPHRGRQPGESGRGSSSSPSASATPTRPRASERSPPRAMPSTPRAPWVRNYLSAAASVDADGAASDADNTCGTTAMRTTENGDGDFYYCAATGGLPAIDSPSACSPVPGSGRASSLNGGDGPSRGGSTSFALARGEC